MAIDFSQFQQPQQNNSQPNKNIDKGVIMPEVDISGISINNTTIPYNDRTSPAFVVPKKIGQEFANNGVQGMGFLETTKKEDYTIEQMVEDMRKNSMRTEYDRLYVEKNGYQSHSLIPKDNKIDVGGKFVPLHQTHKQLHDGSWIPKFETYYVNGSSEEILAKQQSRIDKWINGVAKAGIKHNLRMLEGTIGSVYGLAEAIKHGSISAFRDNDFTRYMDDLNSRLDFHLPNYYSQEEKNKGFFASMGTANFWANDVLDGLSFLTSTIASEAIWAYVTGGASLPTAFAKGVLRVGAKGIATAGAKNASKAFFKESMKVLRAYEKTIPASKFGSIVNNTRFMFTSSAFESGFEARHSEQENRAKFIDSYIATHGHYPPVEVMQEFMADNIKASNYVFGANMALLSASNVLQLGSYFGVGTGLNKGISKSIGKAFGIGFTKTTDEAGNIVLKALKPNKVQKILGTAFYVSKNPVIEGLEETGQGIASRTSDKWIEARYNPKSLKSNYDVIDAFIEAFEASYSTNEGRKEFGLGALIGFIGGARNRNALGGNSWGGFTEYSAQQKVNENQVKNFNEKQTMFTQATNDLVKRLVASNQFDVFLGKSQEESEKGNATEASINFDIAQFSKMLSEEATDMLDDSVSAFENSVDAIDNQKMMSEYGISEEQAQEYKQKLKENYSQNVELFKKSKDIAEAVNPVHNKKGIMQSDATQKLALNIYLGVKSFERMKSLAEDISSYIDKSSNSLWLTHYFSEKEVEEVAGQIDTLEADIAELQEENERLQLSFTATNLDRSERDEKNNDVKERIKENREIHAIVTQKLLGKEKELEQKKQQLAKLKKEYENYISNRFHGIIGDFEFLSEEDIMEAYRALKGLTSYRENLHKKHPEQSEILEQYITEYNKNVKAFREFNIAFENLSNEKYNDKRIKGLSRAFLSKGVAFDEVDKDNPYNEQLDAYIEKVIEENKDKLSEDEKHIIRTLGRINSAMYLDVNTLSDDNHIEVISELEYNDFKSGAVSDSTKESIAEAVYNGLELTPRQLEIFNDYKDDILGLVKRKRIERGDIVEEKPLEQPYDNNTLKGRLLNLIERLKHRHKYLQGLDNDIDFKSKVSDEEYIEFEDLVNKKSKEELDDVETERYNELREKINTWGKAEVVSSDIEGNDYNFADLLEELHNLEQIENNKEVETRLADIEDLFDLEFAETFRDRNHRNLQSYDKVMVSKDPDGSYVVSNISLSGFLQLLEPNKVSMRYGKVGAKKKMLTYKNGILDVSNIKVGDEIEVSFGVVETTIEYLDRGRIRVRPNGVSLFHSKTSLFFTPKSLTGLGYMPLYRKVVTSEGVKLLPINSDFEFVDKEVMDIEAMWDLKEGSELNFEIDTRDEWNKSLIERYENETDAFKKDEIKKEMLMNLHIFARDKKGKLVGVVKVISPKSLNSFDDELKGLFVLRETALDNLLNRRDDEVKVSVNYNMKVKSVYVGHPNLDIEVTNEGAKVVSHNISSEEKKMISDIGYIENGKVFLRNGTTKYADDFIKRIRDNQSKTKKGGRVPIVIFKHKNKVLAYPVSVGLDTTDRVSEAEEIFNSDIPISDKIGMFNMLLSEAGLSIDRYGLSSTNYTEAKLQESLKALEEAVNFIEVKSWLSSKDSISDILDNSQAQINIDLTNNPFHSPKIKMNLGFSAEYSSEVEENFNYGEDEVTFDISFENDLDDYIEEEC